MTVPGGDHDPLSRESAAKEGPKRVRPRAMLKRLWAIRFGVALGAGLLIGAAAGVVGVNTLEPGHPAEPDSLQMMLDSITRGTAPARPSTPEPAAAAPPRTDTAAVDTLRDTTVADTNAIAVPDVVGVDEGGARTMITNAGLTIGNVEFRASRTPAGTVLATVPVFGVVVPRGRAITLVLSDGRPPVDTIAAPRLSSRVTSRSISRVDSRSSPPVTFRTP